jgi:hypothetical protein
VQLGRMPSQRIFLERQRSHAWAMRAWQLEPTLITFMGSIPGMVAVGVRRVTSSTEVSVVVCSAPKGLLVAGSAGYHPSAR